MVPLYQCLGKERLGKLRFCGQTATWNKAVDVWELWRNSVCQGSNLGISADQHLASNRDLLLGIESANSESNASASR